MAKKEGFEYRVRVYVRPIGTEVYDCYIINVFALSYNDEVREVNKWFKSIAWKKPMEGYFVTFGNDIRTYLANQEFD